MQTIPYSKQSINEEDLEAVCSVLRSDWLTQGPRAGEFEKALSSQCGARHCILVSNGTMALHLACLALDMVPEDVGMTSPLSFLASAYCITLCGGKVDFADIDPKTLCLSPKKVEEYCENHSIPKVVIPVDFAGVPADMPKFRVLSVRYGFKLIEDAAHAIGSTYTYDGNAYACGSCAHTDMAVFSFHPVKTITTGEGGAVLTNDDQLAEKLRHLANHGIERDPSKFTNPTAATHNPNSFPSWYYEMQSLGYNGRITDIQSALGLSQLKRLKQFKARRQEIVRHYNLALRELEEKQIVTLPPWPDGTDPCYHLYPLRLGPGCRIHRDELFHRLREKGINGQVHYIPIYRQPFYQKDYHFKPGQFPETERYFTSCLSLPLFPDMDEEVFQYVVKALHSILNPEII
ncbi:MAG: UDP-4-amino-4,6-dideoxy-N-acetyl-beta-L-altrosamine transaminase [Desulfatiglandales bacterium]|nr:UDP-4-amino-4,6-dideoxy-N-acetyl-beta-L-altrosamine transaminase [Desulfatiglandales bacterium]